MFQRSLYQKAKARDPVQMIRARLVHILHSLLGQPYIAGMECTGSTLVYQIARAIGARPKKIHSYVYTPLPILVTYRDPRDIICSYARRQFREIYETEGSQTALMKSHHRLFIERRRQDDLYKYRDRSHALLLRYESYFNGREAALADAVAAYLGIDLDSQTRDRILSEYSLECNRARASQFSAFRLYDRVTHIHGYHISNDGQPGAWRVLFTPTITRMVKRDIGQLIIDFGYERDDDWSATLNCGR